MISIKQLQPVCIEEYIKTMSESSHKPKAAPEYHMLLIWDRGMKQFQRILNDLEVSFSIVFCGKVTWKEGEFSDKLIGFYDNEAVKKYLPGKIERIGVGPFQVIVIQDKAPLYAERETTHGPDTVNVNVFDKKQLYREWVGHNAIHGSDSKQEAVRDLHYLADDLRASLPPSDALKLSSILSASNKGDGE